MFYIVEPSEMASWVNITQLILGDDNQQTIGKQPVNAGGTDGDPGARTAIASPLDPKHRIGRAGRTSGHVPVESLNATRDNMLRGLTWLVPGPALLSGRSV